MTTCAVLLGALVGPGVGTASAAVGAELLSNPGLETANGSNDAPAWWSASSWGTNTNAFTWSTDAHDGSRSVRVQTWGYANGDSKWVPDPIPVTGGSYYTFSDWYKSDRTSAVSVNYWLQGEPVDGGGHWANLFSGIAPASDWTQYKTGFTMPAGAVRAAFVHFIAGDGYLQTDDYSAKEQETPPGFHEPMISLTFDDASQVDYENALPLLDAKGFKSTQYVPTFGLTQTPQDPFLMSRSEITEMASHGHEIAGHSVTHPFLSQLDDTALAHEFTDKATLESIAGVGPVHNFAYPYGDYDARVIAAAKAAGYRSARSVEEGYNSRLDFEPYDIRVQNMTPDVTLATFKSWVDYAAAHKYWLVIVYHEVVPNGSPRCTGGAGDPSPCLGAYDTTVESFGQQLDYISQADLGSSVKTVQEAMDLIDAERKPVAGAVKISPANPMTNATVTATPSGFTDPDNDTLTYHYQWKVNGTAISGATGSAFDLSQAGHGNAGDVVSVDVYASDPDGHNSSAVSDNVTVDATPQTTPEPDRSPATRTDPSPAPAPAPNPGLAAAPSAMPTDKQGPKIVVTGPKARTYKVGRTLKVAFSISDRSGVARWKATIRRGRGKARAIKKGDKLRLTRPGTYELRITATDRNGNTATRRVRFSVTRG